MTGSEQRSIRIRLEQLLKQRDRRAVKRKLAVFEYAKAIKNVEQACRDFGISRSCYFKWKNQYKQHGEAGLVFRNPSAQNAMVRMKKDVEEKILEVRREHNFGPDRIVLYLKRYQGLVVNGSSVYRALKRNGLNLLPKTAQRRAPGPVYKRYEKTVPGHHLQVDVKFLTFYKNSKKIRRFQYTAIDDATRVRILQIYPKHNQDCAIKFMNHVTKKLPFRIKMIRTDNGHEFQARFHWHIKDLGIEHVYIKKGTPRLNGKVERSHRTDQEEFYQLLSYKDDVDLNKKLEAWENYYNFDRPHMSKNGATPYESLKEKMSLTKS